MFVLLQKPSSHDLIAPKKGARKLVPCGKCQQLFLTLFSLFDVFCRKLPESVESCLDTVWRFLTFFSWPNLASPKPHPSKPQPCDTPQAKTEVALRVSECCAAKVALQHSLFCSADVICTKSCAAANEKLHCNIEKAALQESGAFLPLSCGFQAPTFRHPRLGPADEPPFTDLGHWHWIQRLMLTKASPSRSWLKLEGAALRIRCALASQTCFKSQVIPDKQHKPETEDRRRTFWASVGRELGPLQVIPNCRTGNPCCTKCCPRGPRAARWWIFLVFGWKSCGKFRGNFTGFFWTHKQKSWNFRTISEHSS